MAETQLTLDEIMWGVIETTGISRALVLSPSKVRYHARARQQFAYEAHEAGYTGTQVGFYMGVSKSEALAHARKYKKYLEGWRV